MSLFTPHAEPGRQPCRLLQAAAQQLALKSHTESKPEHLGTKNDEPKSAWHRPHSTPRLSAFPLLVFCIVRGGFLSALTKDILVYRAAWHLVDVDEEHTVIHCDVLVQRNSQGGGE